MDIGGWDNRRFTTLFGAFGGDGVTYHRRRRERDGSHHDDGAPTMAPAVISVRRMSVRLSTCSGMGWSRHLMLKSRLVSAPFRFTGNGEVVGGAKKAGA